MLLLLAGAGAARAQAIGEGFDLERSGRPDKAADVYFATLRADPTNLAALLGLERVLPELNRRRDVLPPAERAVARDSTNPDLQALLLRAYIGLNEPDTAGLIARRWARRRPDDPRPYREWAIALEDVSAYDAAGEVLLAGRQALRRPAAFAIELAELRARLGDWVAGAREWATAVTAAAEQIPNAAAQLSEVPAAKREAVIQTLTGAYASGGAQRVAGELLLSWGDPARAWSVYEPTAAAPSPDAAYALRRFADLAAALGTPAGWRVRGLALSRFADVVPRELAVRARAEGARALLEAGDGAAARELLLRVAADSAAPPDAQQLAHATLIQALIQEGQLDSASARLAVVGARLSAPDQRALRFALTQARVRAGDLVLAGSALAGDSSIDALAMYSWIALYRGDLREAWRLSLAAGPYERDELDATARTAMLALIERIPYERFPPLGHALLVLAQGDSLGAVSALRGAADQLPPTGGRADVLLFAGRIAVLVAPDSDGTAASLFDDVVRTGGTGAAPPAAELAWAQLLLRQGRDGEAVQHLEHLILTYPKSAVVPEARRELERTKGAIPKS